MNEYICDDRNQLEEVKKINSMTDEEFAEYIKSTKTETNTDNRP